MGFLGNLQQNMYSSKKFEEKYTYEKDDLGANYLAQATTFRVWAPLAHMVQLKLYEGGDARKGNEDLILQLPMESAAQGTWELRIEGDLHGIYYTYQAILEDMDAPTKQQLVEEIVDPYAKAVGVNGQRAMVVDLERTNPKDWELDKNPREGYRITDAIIYEVSIRDQSMHADSGVKHKGQYLGMIEEGTRNSYGQPTGLDHMKDLGVTHVQLMPMYDYGSVDERGNIASQYNWGYDPVNYNVPEGSYATDAYHGEVRIEECKRMIQGLHQNGFGVIMDVVYNHTYDENFCMNRLTPGYCYRPDSNGTACGNDVASERSMMRQFIVDSVRYWTKEYHIDGFRFDLVGILDVDTMNAIREAVDEIRPGVLLYGEGWTLETKPTKEIKLAIQKNVSLMKEVALFNDVIRDGLKGSVFIHEDRGYVNGNYELTERIAHCLMGQSGFNTRYADCINYASCHDNLTLWDEIGSSNAEDSLEERVRQNLLAASAIMLAPGTPFMLSGEEMLRSKVREDGTYEDNSYVSGDQVNAIRWDCLGGAEVKQVYQTYRKLIGLRKRYSMLHATDASELACTRYEGVSSPAIGILYQSGKEQLLLVLNPEKKPCKLTLPEGSWKQVYASTEAENKNLCEGEIPAQTASLWERIG